MAGVDLAVGSSAARLRPPVPLARTTPRGTSTSQPIGAQRLLALQRTAGNRAVDSLLVLRSPEPLPGGPATRPLPAPGPTSVAAADPVADVPSSVATVVGALGVDLLRAARSGAPPGRPVSLGGLGGGEAIDPDVRAPFERSYGYDLSPIRVHRGPSAERAAQAAQATAFTLGDHVVLGSSYDLTGPSGQHVLGHELAHAVQSRLGGGGVGRVSEPGWPAELEAERAAQAAGAGRPHVLRERADGDLHRIAPWLVLAGIGLAAGLVVWAVSDSPDENRARHAAGEPNRAEEVWALIPVYGSVQQIREADSYFQRVLGVGFLMLDFATLGTAGVAGRAILKAPGALVRTAIARRGAVLAVREGGEIASEAMARETAAAFTREGGALLASQAAASNEMFAALQRGSLVVVTEGGLNHAVVYAKNAAGQVMRVHGGPLRVLFAEAPREMSSRTAQGMARRVNAYFVIEGAEATVGIEQAAARVAESGPAALRWLGGNPTSCGIAQNAVLEASGLSTATLAKLVPAGGASARMLPISVLDTAATSGRLVFVEGGMTRIIGGTVLQGGLLGVGGTIGPVTSSLVRFAVNGALPEVEATSSDGPQAPGPRGRTPASDDVAIEIVRRFGRAPTGPVREIRTALPDVAPGWYVMSSEFHESVRLSLVHLGMEEAIAQEIIGS